MNTETRESTELIGVKMSREIAQMILEANAVEIREVPERVTNEEVWELLVENQPFLYASGNWGPGYVSVKGMVSHPKKMTAMVGYLGRRVAKNSLKVNFVAGNLTGGVIPGWLLSKHLSFLYHSPVGFVLVYGSRPLDESDEKTRIVAVDKNKLLDVLVDLRETVEHYREHEKLEFDFVAGCAPSGMPLGYDLSKKCSVPFVYIREARKKGGQKELITGNRNNPFIQPGCTGLVVGQTEDLFRSSQAGVEILENEGYRGVSIGALLREYSPFTIDLAKKITFEISDDPDTRRETFTEGSVGIDVEELVNFSETTCNSCRSLRLRGYQVDHAATILYYNNPGANQMLTKNNIQMTYVVTLKEVIDAAKSTGKYSAKAADDYLAFLSDPSGWQAARGLKRVQGGGTL